MDTEPKKGWKMGLQIKFYELDKKIFHNFW